MRITLLHTNPFHQEIEDLILDIISNFKLNDFKLFEYHYPDFKWYKIFELKKLRYFIKDNKIDIIHTYAYSDAYYALLASKGLGVKVIYSCYFYHDELTGLNKRMFRYVLENVDSVIIFLPSAVKLSTAESILDTFPIGINATNIRVNLSAESNENKYTFTSSNADSNAPLSVKPFASNCSFTLKSL